MTELNVLSLFSGIGGLELGLERAGMTTVGQVELDPFCRRVLARHWPEVPRHDDVRTAVDWWRSEQRPVVHVVAGGFPCQPFSNAGRKRGTADERWGWPWMAAVVRHLRPDYVVVENVARVRGAMRFTSDHARPGRCRMTCLCELRCPECHTCECRPGTCWLCTGAAKRVSATGPRRLTPTQERVRELVDLGWVAARIAAEVGVAQRTVEKIRQQLRVEREAA